MVPLLVGLSFLLPGQNVEPVAMVLTVKGTGTAQQGQQPARPLRAMMVLQTGEKLTVAADGEALLVFLADGRREKVRAKATATVGAKGCEPAAAVDKIEGPKLASASLGCLRELGPRSARGGVGVLRGDPPARPQLVTPIYGSALLTTRPNLSWSKEPGSDAYLVQVYTGAEGANSRLLWQEKTTDRRLSFPEKQAALTLGRLYHWKVLPLKGEEAGEAIVSSKFHVLTPAEQEALAETAVLIKEGTAADLALAASLFEAHGVTDEALLMYERLATQAPNEPSFQRALASYYERAGRPELAKAARQRLEKLEPAPATSK